MSEEPRAGRARRARRREVPTPGPSGGGATTATKLLDLVVAVLSSVGVGVGWIVILLQGGLFVRADDPWARTATAYGVVGYAALALAIWWTWATRPWFARPAAVIGGGLLVLELVAFHH